MVKVAVMGAGSWGTTLAKVFADAGNEVVLWVRKEAVARKIQISRENEKYLPGLILPRGIAATSDPLVALSDADIVVLAVPSQTLRENLARWKDDIPADATLVSLAKGIERGYAFTHDAGGRRGCPGGSEPYRSVVWPELSPRGGAGAARRDGDCVYG